MKRFVALAVPIALAFACAPDGLSSTCRFTGDTTNPCGQCIAKSCQTYVDSCCADTLCRDFLSGVDRCASGGSCISITIGTAPSLETCVATSCRDVCAIASSSAGSDAGTTTPKKDAGVTFTSDCSPSTGDYGCTCTPTGGSTTACTEDTVAIDGNPGFCCADRGWPEANTLCSCTPFTCVDVSPGGYYSWDCEPKNQHSHVFEATDTRCCVSGGTCKCRGSFDECGYNESRVTACSAAVAGCRSDQTRVSSCTIP